MEHIERVRLFLARRAQMKGIDPDMIYGLDGNQYVLTVEDLTALCDDAESWRKRNDDIRRAITSGMKEGS